MSQRTLKEIKYDGSDVIVEVARRDALGNVINTTYATNSDLSRGLNNCEPTVSWGAGLQRVLQGNLVSVKPATASALGGIKVGSGLNVTSDGTLSVGEAGSVAWDNVSNKPFASVSSSDFVVSSNTLSLDAVKWASKSFLATAYVSLSTYNEYVGETAPARYQAKITSDNKLSYSLLSGTPTKVSDFTNDSGFITSSVNNLTNYYKKSETYTKSEVNGLINGIDQFEYEVVSTLPTASASTMHKIYLVPSANSTAPTSNIKDEYITIRSGSEGSYTYAWEQIGTTAVDLSDYLCVDPRSPFSMTDGSIVIAVGRDNNVIGSGKTIASSGALANSNTTIPTSNIIYTAVSAKQDALTQASNGGNGITITNGVIASVITATDVTLDY